MRYFLIVLILFISQAGISQLYKTTFGARLDDAQFGLSLTQRILPKTSIEVYGDMTSNFVQAGAVVRQHLKIAGRRMNYYPIVGMHTGYYKDRGGFSGSDLGIGAEYKFILMPLSMSFDVVPSVHFIGNHADWWTFNTVFSIKYILVEDKRIKLPRRKESDDD
jgi:hypothetical protein